MMVEIDQRVPRHLFGSDEMTRFSWALTGREVFWYVIYKVTNISKQKTASRMCLDIWLSTDARYRVIFPLSKKQMPGIEGFKRDLKRSSFPDFDDLARRTRWGEGAGRLMPRYEGSGACFHDGFQPAVQKAIEIRAGRKLLSAIEINESPLGPGETREGVAIFAYSPVEEYKIYSDALNHLYVQADQRREAENALGMQKLEFYVRFFPEGQYIENVQKLLTMRGNIDSVVSEVGRLRAEQVKELKNITADYDKWIAETRLFTEALMHFEFFAFDEALEILDKLYIDYPKGEHRMNIQRLRVLAKQKLMYEARQEARKVRLEITQVKSLSPSADRIYLTVSGLTDTVFSWKDDIYAQVKLRQFVYRRMGGETHRDFDSLNLVETRWVAPDPRPIRKVVPIETD
jgi:hypothetical protein